MKAIFAADGRGTTRKKGFVNAFFFRKKGKSFQSIKCKKSFSFQTKFEIQQKTLKNKNFFCDFKAFQKHSLVKAFSITCLKAF